MTADIDGYTELAQIALTWMQSNLHPDQAEAQARLKFLNEVYGQQAIYTGFQVALAMLLRHGANAASLDQNTYIEQVRGIINDIASQHKQTAL